MPSCPFLALPQEIRDHILELLLESQSQTPDLLQKSDDDNNGRLQEKLPFGSIYYASKLPPINTSALLATCRQLSQEMTATIRRLNATTVNGVR